MDSPQPKIDRRILRTRQALRQALLELIVLRGYDTLTIQDITERANVRRATFYLHYRDKETLLEDALMEITAELARQAGALASTGRLGGKTRPEAYRMLFDHADQYHALYKSIFSSQNGMVFARKLQSMMAEIILHSLQADSGSLAVPAEVLANAIAGTEMAMVIWWLENDRPYPAAQMAEFVYQVVLRGAGQAAGIDLDTH